MTQAEAARRLAPQSDLGAVHAKHARVPPRGRAYRDDVHAREEAHFHQAGRIVGRQRELVEYRSAPKGEVFERVVHGS